MLMKTRLFLILCGLLLFFGSVFAASISDYRVPSQVLLNEDVTAVGTFSGGADTWCSFYILDATNRTIIYRSTDQITVGSGQFAMNPKQITEPTFLRGRTYTVESICSDAVADANFVMAQRRTIADQAANEFEALTNPQNVDTIIIWVILGGTIIFILFIFVFLFNKARGK